MVHDIDFFFFFCSKFNEMFGDPNDTFHTHYFVFDNHVFVSLFVLPGAYA